MLDNTKYSVVIKYRTPVNKCFKISYALLMSSEGKLRAIFCKVFLVKYYS